MENRAINWKRRRVIFGIAGALLLAQGEGGVGAVLVEAGALWSYLDDGSDQGSEWRATGFDDSQWARGRAQLGYGDADVVTTVSFGPDAGNKYITTYFRHTFVVEEASLLSEALTVGLVRDDGAVVYLNGREVFRSNMPAGTVGYLTTALAAVGGDDESEVQSVDLAPGDLVVGTNLVAVEVHQAGGTSSDVSFDFVLSTSQGNPLARLTRDPYVQLVTPRTVVLRWRTDAPTASVVRYGTNVVALTRSNRVSELRTDHEVRLDGLAPDTRYFYSVGTATGVLVEGTEYYAITAPLEGAARPTRIWVLGDSGRVNAGARAVRDAYFNFTGSRHTDVVLMLGDNAYENGTDAEMQAAIFGNYGALLRHSPLWPALGNHDTANSPSPSATLPHFVNFTLPAAGEAGGIPSGTEKYWSFDFGNIHFVCLDSMSSSRASDGAMANWLRSDLAAHGQRFVIAYYHHPPHSRGSAPADATSESIQMRSNINPILEAGGVDLVLAGHSHNYERSFLIDGYYGATGTFSGAMKRDGGDGRVDGDGAYFKPGTAGHEGTVYVVAGTACQADSGALDHPAMYRSFSMLGSVVIDVVGTRMDVRFLDTAAVVRDSFSIEKTLPDHVVITRQPTPQAVEPGESVTFSVSAISGTPIRYQWRKDGLELEGATERVLELVNVQSSDAGAYDVVVSDDSGATNSQVAYLLLLVAPAVLSPPLELSVVEGGTVTFSVATEGSLPMGYRWRRGGATLTNWVLQSHQSFFTITNARLTDAGIYTVALTNVVSYQPGVLSPRGSLTVLADADGDGLPDEWELAVGLRSDNPADAAWDMDGDGFTSAEEYAAGTDPGDAASALRIEAIELGDELALRFWARSNTTYTVEYRERPPEGPWRKLADVVAEDAARMEVVTDRSTGGRRYYRVVTPRRP